MSKYLFLFTGWFAALLPAHSHAQTSGCFGAVNNYSVAIYPNAIVSADFNSDGKADLATANVGTINVSVLLGTGTGSFNTAVTYPAANGLKAITSADFNGDGKADLATVNGGGYQVLFGTGTGSFALPSYHGMNYGPDDMVSADFNNDGKPDLAMATSNQGHNISVATNTGSGGFAPEIYYSALGTVKIAAGDFNGDGKVDIAAGQNNGGLQSGFSVLYNTGAGAFSAAAFFTGGIYATAITAADFNGDGKSDLALTSSYVNDAVYVFLGAGTGSFVATGIYSVGISPRGITAADFNGDGNLDLAASNYSSTNVSILYGTGTGNFGAAVNYPIGNSPTGITAADLNGDAMPDLAMSVNYTAAAVLLNTASTLSITASTTSLCAGSAATLNVSGANTYTWTGGSNTSALVVSPGVSTVYSVSGTNSVGCISNTATLDLTVKPLPTLIFSSTHTMLCLGDSSAVSVTGASSYTWNTGAQTPGISFIANATPAFSVAGTSSITGCTAGAVFQLSVSVCTGIKILQMDSHVMIFPNPASSTIELRIENAELMHVNVEIINIFGEIIKTHTFSSEKSTIEIHALQNGVYFLRLNDHVQKFVKE